mgnify:CR=1 FL=1
MQNYTKYTFNSTNEILVARLFDLGFDSFQELENSSEGYIRDDMITVELNASVNEIAKEYDAEYVVEKLENKNWNEIWEANFEPVTVGKFCAVRADFHEANGSVANDIIINPKMAFGTGHHATTFMMMKMMERQGQIKKVLDLVGQFNSIIFIINFIILLLFHLLFSKNKKV